jgi:hypothetical protein
LNSRYFVAVFYRLEQPLKNDFPTRHEISALPSASLVAGGLVGLYSDVYSVLVAAHELLAVIIEYAMLAVW